MTDAAVPEPKTRSLPLGFQTKITRELQFTETNWGLIKRVLLQAGVNVAQGYKLTVPANYPGKTALGVVLPDWVLLEPPGGAVLLIEPPPPQAAGK